MVNIRIKNRADALRCHNGQCTNTKRFIALFIQSSSKFEMSALAYQDLEYERQAVDEESAFISSILRGKRQRNSDDRALVSFGGGAGEDESDTQEYFSRFESKRQDDNDDIEEVTGPRPRRSSAAAAYIRMDFMPATGDSNEARGDAAPGAADKPKQVNCFSTSPEYDEILSELGEPDPPNQCWGCTHHRSDTTALAYQVCVRMEDMYRNRAANTHPVQLARDLEAYFDEKIRKRQNQKAVNRRSAASEEEACSRWRAATIHAHCTEHRVDSSTEILTMVRELQSAKKFHVRNNLYRQRIDPETGGIVKYPTLEGVKILKELNIQLKDAFKLRPQTLLFNSSASPALQSASPALVDTSKKRVYGDMGNQFV